MPGPTIRRRELGARLRSHRQAAGLTVEDVAQRLFVSAPKISRIETAQRGVTLRDVRDLAQIYRLPVDEIDLLMQLARESQQRSSWQRYSNRISNYAEIEEAAIFISDYESAAVPALLQTKRYAEALAVGVDPQATDLLRQQAVEARMARQAAAFSRSQSISAVMDEAALCRVVGGRDVMREQMAVLLERLQLPNVAAQVIDFEAGAHPGMDSTFILLKLDGSVADVVYVEGLIGSMYLELPTDIARYEHVFSQLQALALSPEATMDKIRFYRDNYASC